MEGYRIRKAYFGPSTSRHRVSLAFSPKETKCNLKSLELKGWIWNFMKWWGSVGMSPCGGQRVCYNRRCLVQPPKCSPLETFETPLVLPTGSVPVLVERGKYKLKILYNNQLNLHCVLLYYYSPTIHIIFNSFNNSAQNYGTQVMLHNKFKQTENSSSKWMYN